MHTTVHVAAIEPGARENIATRFAEFDAADSRADSKTVRRQLFHYHDLLVHVIDTDAPTAAGYSGPDLSGVMTGSGGAAPTAAARYYHWLAGPTDPGMFSTLVVNRLVAARRPRVAALFADFDTTDVPHHMGTRRRQLFACDGIYFHLQDFDTEDGGGVIADAWKRADPRFIKICDDLDPLIDKYDPATWRKPADAVAHRFYHWEAA